MANGAIYYLSNGLISTTINPCLTNKEQIAGLSNAGLGHAIIPEGKDSSTGMINLETGEYTDYNPAPVKQIPNLWVQLTAALVNNGVVTADSFHPATIVEINSALADVNMLPVALLK